LVRVGVRYHARVCVARAVRVREAESLALSVGAYGVLHLPGGKVGRRIALYRLEIVRTVRIVIAGVFVSRAAERGLWVEGAGVPVADTLSGVPVDGLERPPRLMQY
jgi:hypothetical protein